MFHAKQNPILLARDFAICPLLQQKQRYRLRNSMNSVANTYLYTIMNSLASPNDLTRDTQCKSNANSVHSRAMHSCGPWHRIICRAVHELQPVASLLA